MNQKQMSSEVTEFENALPDNPLGTTNTTWDQSAKTFSAVIDNPNILPDDKDHQTGTRGPDHNAKQRDTRKLKNTKKTKRTPMTLSELYRLQEEHALWLK